MLNSLNIDVLEESQARVLPAAQLAYVGDAVFDVFVRTHIVYMAGDWGIHEINRIKVGIVKASQQARIAKMLMAHLNEVEQGVLKRGRNAKSQSVPKNAVLADYRYATGFEALVGYLVLSGQGERLNALLELAWELCEGDGLLTIKTTKRR